MTSGRFRIVFLLNETDHERTGGTARTLSHLVALGHPVPEGFVVSADAYRTHFWRSGAKNLAADGVSSEDTAEIRRMIFREPLAPDVADAVAMAYTSLCPANEAVTVKLSIADGSEKDRDVYSIYESPINASGIEAVLGAVKKAWCSIWTEQAAAYREKVGMKNEPLAGVVIQKAVQSVSHGRVMTVDPSSGDPNKVVVEAFDSKDHSLKSSYAVELSGHTVCEKQSEGKEVLPEALILHLVEIALLIDDQFGRRMEIEWVFDGGRFLILDAKPLGDTSVYFPVSWVRHSESTLQWKCLSRQCLSYFARSLPVYSAGQVRTPFAATMKSVIRRYHNGYAYVHRSWLCSPDNLSKLPWTTRFMLRFRELNSAHDVLCLWEKQVLPYIRSKTSRVLKADQSKASQRRLLRRLKTIIDLHDLMQEWYDILWYRSLRVPEMVEEMMAPVGVDEDTLKRLFAGVEDWNAKRDAELAVITAGFKSSEGNDTSVVRKRFDSFVRTYGYAYSKPEEKYDPALWTSWIEDKSAILTTPPSAHGTSAGSEDSGNLVSELEGKLKWGARRKFRRLLKLARRWFSKMSEREIVLAQVQSALRVVAIELGNRLVDAGVLSEANEVFFFTHDEMLRFPRRLKKRRILELKKLIIHRKHQMWLDRRLKAPDTIPFKPESAIAAPIPKAEVISAQAENEAVEILESTS